MKCSHHPGLRAVSAIMALLLAAGLAGCSGKDEKKTNGSSEDNTSFVEPWAPESSAESGAAEGSEPSSDASGEPGTATDSQGGGQNQNPASGSQKPETSSSPDNKPAKLVGNTYTTGFPICKEKEAINLMVVKSVSHGDFNTMNYTKAIQEKMNVAIKWVLVPENSQHERKTLAFQSGNLPDIMILFSGIISNAELAQYSKEGTLLELGSSIPSWAPNIKKTIDQYPSAKAAVTSPDGKIYTLPSVGEGKISRILSINVKWLKNLGLQKPKTMDEFRDVLKAFRDNDPDKNGKKDTIPAAFQTWEPIMWWPWGLNCNFEDNFVITKGGQVKYAWATDNFKAGIKYWSQLYKDGLLDAGHTIDNLDSYDHYIEVLKKGNVGVFSWPWPVDALGVELASQYEPLAIPDSGFKNADFDTPVVAKSPEGNHHAVITKAAKSKLSTVLRFLDYSYTAEGQYLQSYGDTSTGFYTVSNGTYKLNDNSGKNALQVAPGWVMTGNSLVTKPVTYQKKPAEMTKVEKANYEYQQKQDALYNPLVKETFPNVILSAAEADAIKKYESWWNGGLRQAIPFMNGEMNVDTQWNQYYQTLLGRDLKTLEATYQKAYDRVKGILKK